MITFINMRMNNKKTKDKDMKDGTTLVPKKNTNLDLKKTQTGNKENRLIKSTMIISTRNNIRNMKKR